jgi:cellulose synthase/poly-beta-1,6-N-acetylglucosamine synthase-like glycosyltransferase
MNAAFYAYLVLGPVLWLLFAASMAMSHARMNRLRRPIKPLPSNPPKVTVLIPAKDEGEPVRGCLDRVLALDYPDFTVIAVDDRSIDSTGAIFDEFAASHPQKFTAMHIPHSGLPAGWLGKCNALHTAAAHAEGEWLLFVDSDVKVEPDSLAATLALALEREYDAVSIMSRLECDGFWETLILPLCAASVGGQALMSLTNDDNRKSIAFANGQFFLIKRSAYEKVGGHAAVRDNIVEDVGLMRILKSADFRTRLYFGRNFASTRMHTTLRQMFNGWARIYSGVCNRRPAKIVLAMVLILSGLSAYIVLAASLALFAAGHAIAARWVWLSIAHVAVLTVVVATIYRLSGNPMRYALAFPVGGPVLLAIHAYAVRACRTGRIAWRGTSYTSGSSAPAAVTTKP